MKLNAANPTIAIAAIPLKINFLYLFIFTFVSCPTFIRTFN
jgi:hypothetical protein